MRGRHLQRGSLPSGCPRRRLLLRRKLVSELLLPPLSVLLRQLSYASAARRDCEFVALRELCAAIRRHRARRLRFHRAGGRGILMRRNTCSPRRDWERKVEEVGLSWHTGSTPYWNESAYYEFSAREVDVIEAATNNLHGLCLKAVQHVIDNKLYARLGIPEMAVPLIEGSWEAEPPSIYGRFD